MHNTSASTSTSAPSFSSSPSSSSSPETPSTPASDENTSQQASAESALTEDDDDHGQHPPGNNPTWRSPELTPLQPLPSPISPVPVHQRDNDEAGREQPVDFFHLGEAVLAPPSDSKDDDKGQAQGQAEATTNSCSSSSNEPGNCTALPRKSAACTDALEGPGPGSWRSPRRRAPSKLEDDADDVETSGIGRKKKNPLLEEVGLVMELQEEEEIRRPASTISYRTSCEPTGPSTA